MCARCYQGLVEAVQDGIFIFVHVAEGRAEDDDLDVYAVDLAGIPHRTRSAFYAKHPGARANVIVSVCESMPRLFVHES